MSTPNRWDRLVALALLSLCGIAAAADKPSGPALNRYFAAPASEHPLPRIAIDLAKELTARDG